MSPHGTELWSAPPGDDGYFNSSYSKGSRKNHIPGDARYIGGSDSPSDVGPTPDSHRGLLSDHIMGSQKGMGPEKKNSVGEIPDARWRPAWLRPAVLSSFLALFVILTVVLPVMLWYSERNDGLVESRQNHVYLWRFGPTAIFTIVSVFWKRVEMQAMRYMPWIVLRRSQISGKEADVYHLDYTAMLSPVALFTSLRNKHYLVAMTAIASLVLKAQIVLAPGLYSLATIRTTEPTDIQLLDFFNTTTQTSLITDGSAYYMYKALDSFDMQYPFGVTKDVAYQTLRFGNGTARGTVDAPLKVNVDGYFSEMECLKLDDYETSEPSISSREYFTFNLTLKFPGCGQSVKSATDRIRWTDSLLKNDGSVGNWVTKMTVGKPCSDLPQQNNQSLYFAARLGPSASNSSQPAFVDFAAVLCTSTSWVSKVEVIDDGFSPNVTILPDEPKTPVVADLWKMLSVSTPEGGGQWSGSGTGRVYGPVDSLTQIKGESLGTTVNVTNPVLYTNDILYRAVMNMSHSLAPLLGLYRVRQNDESRPSSWGDTIASTERLVAIQWVCISMAALFAFLSIVLAFILFRYTGRTAVWYRDPATILGNMFFSRDHPELLSRSTCQKSTSRDRLSEWTRCGFTPMVLRTWTRAASTVFTLGIIFGLLYALNVSRTQGGLATVNEQESMHLLWTSVPALVMLNVALYASCCDFAYRGLANLSSLSSRSCTAREVDVSLLDMLGLPALLHSLRRRIWVVTLSQLLAFICAFLTTLVSVIFTVETIPATRGIDLQHETWFGSTEIGRGLEGLNLARSNRQMISSLVSRQGEAALTYPKNTYDDLVFPVLGGLEDLAVSPNTTVKVTVPAAKLHAITCAKIPSSDFNMNITSWTEETTYFEATVTRPFTCPNGSGTELLDRLDMSAGTSKYGRSLVAGIFKSAENTKDINIPCNLDLNASAWEYAPWRFQTYAWGEFSKEKNGFQSFSMWKCNYTMVEVPTEVSLAAVNGEYAMDPDRPPQPDLSAMESWTPLLDIPHVDNQFISRGVGDAYPQIVIADVLAGTIDEQFKALIKPYGRFPLEDLGNASQDEEILKDLHHNYGLVTAQLVNVENRYNVTESSLNRPAPVGGLPALDATIIDSGRRRLVQSALVTYVLVAILGVVAAAYIWALCSAMSRRLLGKSWLFDMDVDGLAPDGFHSIAAMEALLRGSNVPEHLPESAELLSSNELYGRMSDLNFRLGWFLKAMGEARVFTIGVRGDNEFQYVGSKTRKEWE